MLLACLVVSSLCVIVCALGALGVYDNLGLSEGTQYGMMVVTLVAVFGSAFAVLLS